MGFCAVNNAGVDALTGARLAPDVITRERRVIQYAAALSARAPRSLEYWIARNKPGVCIDREIGS